MERVWRGFAKEFSGKEIRYDDFVLSRSPLPGFRDPAITDAINPTWQKCLDESGIGKKTMKKKVDPEHVAQLRKKIQAHRKQQHLYDDIRKDRELQLVDIWEKELESRRKKQEERSQRFQIVVFKRVKKKPKEWGASRAGSTFLTSVPDVVVPTPAGKKGLLEAVSRQAPPTVPKNVRLAATELRPVRPTGKPTRQRPRPTKNGQKKETVTADETGLVSAEALAKRYPGLAGSAEGRAIKDRGEVNTPRSPCNSVMPQKAQVRRVQMQLLNKPERPSKKSPDDQTLSYTLTSQLSRYRTQLKVHFKRILEAVEAQFQDVKFGKTWDLHHINLEPRRRPRRKLFKSIVPT